MTTRGTSSSQPLTIEPARGVDQVVLDGNHGSRQGCGSPACDGPILAIGRDVDVDLEALVFQDANNKGAGGAIDNALGGTVSVTRSVFRHNSAEDAGAIANASFGGTGTLLVTGSTFSANTSQGGGTISGGGAIDNGDGGGTGTVVVSASTFSDNQGVDGGAIDNADALGRGVLRVSGSTFTGNVAEGSGGAIDNADFKTSYNGPRGSVTVSSSTFSHNRAQGDGGAISSGDWGNVGSLRVSTSTFASNHAGGDGGAIAAGDNFGISPLVVSDSTFWGNSAYHDGGAVASALNGNGPPSPATIVASTFSANSAAGGGYPNLAAQAISSGDVLWAAADIINGSCRWSTFYDGGYNVVSDATCSGKGHHDVRDRGNDLGPLARNGGPTMTLLPLPRSASDRTNPVPDGREGRARPRRALDSDHRRPLPDHRPAWTANSHGSAVCRRCGAAIKGQARARVVPCRPRWPPLGFTLSYIRSHYGFSALGKTRDLAREAALDIEWAHVADVLHRYRQWMFYQRDGYELRGQKLRLRDWAGRAVCRQLGA